MTSQFSYSKTSSKYASLNVGIPSYSTELLTGQGQTATMATGFDCINL